MKIPNDILHSSSSSLDNVVGAKPSGAIVLYQPRLEDQILPYEQALSVALQAWFKLNNFSLNVQERQNAENMSPNGTVPFICINDGITMAGWSMIVTHFHQLYKFKEPKDSPLKTMLLCALYESIVHICWCIPEVYANYTSKRYFAHLPWPLNKIVCYLKKRQMIKLCSSKEIHPNDNAKNTFITIFSEIDRVLDDKPFLGESMPTEVDALLYGFVDALRNVDQQLMPYFGLATILHNINRHYIRMKYL